MTNWKDKKAFVDQMREVVYLGNKSITVAKEDYEKLLEYAEPIDNANLRSFVIGQCGYGIDGCKLCGSTWMRRPDTEMNDHNKECIAYPQN